MQAANLYNQLCAGLPSVFECEPGLCDDVRVRTPFLYPDGDALDIFVEERDGHCVLTDGGETLGWLWMQSVSGELSAKQRYLLDEICRATAGVEHQQGELTVRCERPEKLAEAVFRLAQAMLRVSDLWFLEATAAPAVATATAAATAKEKVG